jgi:hypothetical protein
MEFTMPATPAREPRKVRLARLRLAMAAAGYDTRDMPPPHTVWKDAVQGNIPASADGAFWETTDTAFPEIAERYNLARIA